MLSQCLELVFTSGQGHLFDTSLLIVDAYCIGIGCHAEYEK
jgi:hypothetical protein